MSYIHKETFDIIDGTNIDNDLDNYFECDEAIALPIQELNRKGYITKFCCCGHAFPSITEVYLLDKQENPLSLFEGAYEYEELDDGRIRVVCRVSACREGYIVFDDNSPLPEKLPQHWEYDQPRVMRCYYNDECDEFELLMTIAYSMQKLYEWAKALPKVY